jgi:hypothetical protein
MADEATRPFDRRRPVPTGNILQTLSTVAQYPQPGGVRQLLEGSYCSRMGRQGIEVSARCAANGRYLRGFVKPQPGI